MLLKASLPFLLAALVGPRLSVAQTVPTAAPAGPAALHRPTLYLGVAAATSLRASPDGFSGTPTGPTTYNHVPLLPKLTLGWQVLPRLALQLSGQYAQQTDSYRFLQGSPDVNGQVAYIPGFHSFRLRSVAVPVLARYTLTGDLARRFQVDLLGGTTLVHRSTQYHSLVYLPEPGTIPLPAGTTPEATDVTYAKASTAVHLSLGPSFRCRVASRWQVTAELVGNYRVTEDPIGRSVFSPNQASTRTALTGSLGVAYGLGAH
jgi:hypothetical protein